MKNKYAMVTRCNEKAASLAAVTHPTLKCYATRWNADFIVLDGKYCKSEDYQLNHYMILQVGELLDDYDRILIIDSDVVIMPECENPFDAVDEDKIGSIYEDKGSRQEHRRQIIKDIQAKFGDVGWTEGYINSGFLVVSKRHKKIFEKINGELWAEFGFDDPLLAYNAHKHGFKIQELPCKWNFMSMFSEPWNNNANRFNAYVIHYSGQANFPDDQSGRLKGTNELDSRMRLIIHDTNRIAEGLSGFTVIDPTPKQGLGSTTFNALIGVQEKEIIVKLHSTADGLKRECRAFDGLDIPYIVDCYGISQGTDGNQYMMLQKLKDLPEVIDRVLMRKIATRSLIALRQLWKHDIPWICKLDHIMLNNAGEPKLIDFNDDPCPAIPFYAKEGEEAIMMNSVCDSNGIYVDKSRYPRSGWLAIMTYLCQKNGIPTNVLYEAEYAMVEYEYQHLEDVHQPIYFDQYKDILRRESEKNDPNYGKLVEPNRNCEDRAKMIMDSIDIKKVSAPTVQIKNYIIGQVAERYPPLRKKTWLDIGCNVGWFCFKFSEHFQMTGVDFDEAKIQFATMLAQDERSSCKFEHAEITLEYVAEMPCYDIISALSTLHLKLIEDKDSTAFWNLLKAICDKVNDIFFFEFPFHAFGYLDINSIEHFTDNIRINGNFKDITQIGVSDANRPVLKCIK